MDQANSEHFRWTGDGSGLSVLYAVLRKVVYTQDLYRDLLSILGGLKTKAQLVVDAFQLLLSYPKRIKHDDRHHLLKALMRLSDRTQQYPTCLTLAQVECDDQPMTAGNFGEVYRGRFQGQNVALKVVKLYQKSAVLKNIQAVSREAIIWSNLSHRNVLPFYGIYQLDDKYKRICMVSPWMENGNVQDYLKQGLCPNRVWLLSDVASGIAYLHANGVIHGDIKGMNILITDSGHACLTDFGLSNIAESNIISWSSVCSSSSHSGTIRWQAPEFFNPEDEANRPKTTKSDIYAFACVCYEIMTGNIPFYEYSRDPTVMIKVMHGSRPSKPAPDSDAFVSFGLTELIWELMERCWQREPSLRPEAKDLLNDSSLCIHDSRPTFCWSEESRFRISMALPS
ncbi:kinase-like protein [Coprinopsis marcescibilis]|uniref:Kinase-like protein n=1 Tax=Coprinopsis marcescibilis TaxID=230819 RepID=A0A5C3KU60_COPMA|nr:kinase-like protein [Coprinopsis marcescibilis]